MTSEDNQNADLPARSAHISRDEMNLAEFPLAVLSTRSNPSIKTLEFKDTVLGKNGETVKRTWVITGADKFGLPTASDDEVLLGLLKLSVDEGLESQKVYFTRYELLKILRWSTEGRSYARLQNAFDRLSGVRIKAANAFFDNETKSHSTKNFGIIDAYEINDGREADTKPSFFIWSEELFKSFKVGFIKKLDLAFFLDLQSAVSKRMYRYLDKHFWYKSKVTINLFTLCHEKIGVSRNYRYASSLRQQLDPAIDELIKCGFLSKVEYQGRAKQTTITLYAASKQPRSVSSREPAKKLAAAQLVDDASSRLRLELLDRLEKRGLNGNIGRRLMEALDSNGLTRVEKIISYFDQLLQENSARVSRNPVGFLYRAIEHPFQFSLPDDQRNLGTQRQIPARRSLDSRVQDLDSRESVYREYLSIRAREVARLLDTVEQRVLLNIRSDAEQSIKRLEDVLSSQRYQEALDHAVEERLASLFALPTFDEWRAEKLRTRKSSDMIN